MYMYWKVICGRGRIRGEREREREREGGREARIEKREHWWCVATTGYRCSFRPFWVICMYSCCQADHYSTSCCVHTRPVKSTSHKTCQWSQRGCCTPVQPQLIVDIKFTKFTSIVCQLRVWPTHWWLLLMTVYMSMQLLPINWPSVAMYTVKPADNTYQEGQQLRLIGMVAFKRSKWNCGFS